MQDHRATDSTPSNRGDGSQTLSTIDSRDLFGAKSEIGIEHEGALYRLRITRQGKLILNK